MIDEDGIVIIDDQEELSFGCVFSESHVRFKECINIASKITYTLFMFFYTFNIQFQVG